MIVVYFYSEVMGYTLAVIKSLVKDHGAKVHVVYWDEGTHTHFKLPALDGVTYYKRSSMTRSDLEELLVRLSPQVLYISGRMDQDYLKASVSARKRGTLVVSGFDAQWKRTIKNYLLMMAGFWLYKRYFDYIWIPGQSQYEFARKLGYEDHQIIWNLLSADMNLFALPERHALQKRFVFAGRFTAIKGLHLLIEAFRNSKKIKPHDWELHLIGNGPLRDTLPPDKDIIITDFLQPRQLMETMQDGGVFVLPSFDEPWGVVIHEYAASGFPIICTNVCGASTVFVKDHYNGFIVRAGDLEGLTQGLLQVVNLSDESLLLLAKRSQELSKSITPFIASSSLMAVLKNRKSV